MRKIHRKRTSPMQTQLVVFLNLGFNSGEKTLNGFLSGFGKHLVIENKL
jgi:hypothetical protein